MNKNTTQCYEILLNYSCNASCLFCSQGDYDKAKSASFENIIKQIYIARKEGYVKLGLSGGEPTLREDLTEIIKVARKVGFSFIRIQTNGIKLNDFGFAQKLVKSGLTFCKFSFTSHKPAVHDFLVRVKGAWEKAMEGLENMKKLKVRIGNNILVNKYNIYELEKTVSFFLKKGVSNFVIIYPLYTGNMYLNKEIGISLPQCQKHFINSIKLMKKHKLEDEILFLNVPPCFLKENYQSAIGLSPFNTIVSTPDGKMLNLDYNADAQKVKEKICKKCMLFKNCMGVDRKYIEIFGWKGFKPVKKFYDFQKSRHDKSKKQIYLTDNERCLLEILKKKNNINIKTVLNIAKSLPLCQDCADGNNVINAAIKLASRNIVKMEFKKNDYYLKLIKS